MNTKLAKLDRILLLCENNATAEEISQDLRVQKNTVFAYLKELEERGFIVKVDYKKGQNTPATYKSTQTYVGEKKPSLELNKDIDYFYPRLNKIKETPQPKKPTAGHLWINKGAIWFWSKTNWLQAK